jgi:mono/diheme cytochrome c family protein
MRIALFLFPVILAAQTDDVGRGASVFQMNCSVAYCHGPNGTAGRAPALAGKKYAPERLAEIIRAGFPDKGMPGFGKELSEARIQNLVAYVMSLSGPAAPAGPMQPRRDLPAPAKAGRAVFFDATRLGSCGRCHAADAWGVTIGPDVTKSPPAEVAALRAVAARSVRTAAPPGEAPFPAVVVKTSPAMTLYDLSSALPVLRTFAAADVPLSAAAWNHADVLRGYTDAELESILTFLRALP